MNYHFWREQIKFGFADKRGNFIFLVFKLRGANTKIPNSFQQISKILI